MTTCSSASVRDGCPAVTVTSFCGNLLGGQRVGLEHLGTHVPAHVAQCGERLGQCPRRRRERPDLPSPLREEPVDVTPSREEGGVGTDGDGPRPDGAVGDGRDHANLPRLDH